ncbi:MAG TPA: HsdR family type I site-specific deoxyribonuclease [Candidatus Eisenbacteria bacterium]|nr:HsdR family type I site-specific deoxyribonuclease [Candidatus Eisenbacteria bacterium]
MEVKEYKDKFTEEELEKAIIQLFEDQGYDYVSGDEIHRRYEDVILEDDLKEFIFRKYASYNLTNLEIKTILNKITNISSAPLYLGNREAFLLINEGFNLEREDKSELALHISYIDFETPENNIFKVVNQFTVEDKGPRRPDMLIFVNGIPVSIFEFKTAIHEDTTIHDAWEQIHIRYKRDIPNLLKYSFLSVISDGANTRLGSIFTPYKFYYGWNKINDHERARDGISSLVTMIRGAFSKERLLTILRDFIFYPDDSKREEVIVCRYPQFFAANKMFENIKHEIRPTGSGKGGTYFGATGSGKTYTMLYLSRLLMLREREVFSNPTILIITDREDLDTQTSELFVTAKRFLHEDNVRSIESRKDLKETLDNKPSGGVYLTTIQKFSEDIGLLSDRENIICISDEAHRTQTGTGAKLKKTEEGIFTSYGFAKYLRDSFPNATYVGFTGTPIDETIAVFGDVVDAYTMKESSDDGITERIAYEPRLARVIISEEKSREIEEYYRECSEEGSTEEQIEESKKAMSRMSVILGDPDRLWKMAQDIVEHYQKLTDEKPEIVQKAMIVCSTREIAFRLLNNILKIRPEWGEAIKSEDESELSKQELNKLVTLPKINLVATRGANDEEALYEACGTKEYRKMLDKQFKNNNSNFKIAVVVDMWITGFDVPSLAVMYIDKPLQKHTLIQTISRVNRVFEGKDKGLVVDYIGIKRNMMEAIKIYGGHQESPVDELKTSLKIFRNYLSLIKDMFIKFDMHDYLYGEPLERLMCLNEAAEFIQVKKETQKDYMGLSRRLKAAYNICFPSGELTDSEVSLGQFYLAVRSIIYKQTRGTAPDTEIMNEVVEKMVAEAIQCTGVENIIDDSKSLDLFSEDFLDQLDQVKLPITKFNALLKLLRKAISDYGKTNKVKALEFSERLKRVVDEYNSRDNLAFVSEVTEEFVDNLSEELIRLMRELEEDRNSFEEMGISYEEKAFYDILVNVRDKYEFPYEDEKCVILAKKIKELVDDKAQYTDWSNRNDIKSQLKMGLVILLYENGYPPEWNDEVFNMVLEQAENFKENV